MSRKKIYSYISDAKKSNFDDESIKKKLIQSSYPESEIDRIFKGYYRNIFLRKTGLIIFCALSLALCLLAVKHYLPDKDNEIKIGVFLPEPKAEMKDSSIQEQLNFIAANALSDAIQALERENIKITPLYTGTGSCADTELVERFNSIKKEANSRLMISPTCANLFRELMQESSAEDYVFLTLIQNPALTKEYQNLFSIGQGKETAGFEDLFSNENIIGVYNRTNFELETEDAGYPVIELQSEEETGLTDRFIVFREPITLPYLDKDIKKYVESNDEFFLYDYPDYFSPEFIEFTSLFKDKDIHSDTFELLLAYDMYVILKQVDLGSSASDLRDQLIHSEFEYFSGKVRFNDERELSRVFKWYHIRNSTISKLDRFPIEPSVIII
jgi:hypothetical protein